MTQRQHPFAIIIRQRIEAWADREGINLAAIRARTAAHEAKRVYPK